MDEDQTPQRNFGIYLLGLFFISIMCTTYSYTGSPTKLAALAVEPSPEVAALESPTGTIAETVVTEEAPVKEEMAVLAEAEDLMTVSYNTVDYMCQIKNWGVQFTCDLGNQKLEQKEGASLVLSGDPHVTLSWQRFKDNIHFLGQLNHSFFEALGFYQPGFQTEQTTVAGYKAVLVKGFSPQDPQIQLRDYYYIHDDQLVNLSFKVSPTEKWDEGKVAIKTVKERFTQLSE